MIVVIVDDVFFPFTSVVILPLYRDERVFACFIGEI
jgi:hypothetical protein